MYECTFASISIHMYVYMSICMCIRTHIHNDVYECNSKQVQDKIKQSAGLKIWQNQIIIIRI